MPEYMLLLRSEKEDDLSPTQLQANVQEYIAWAGQLRAAGKMVGGDELQSRCKLIRGAGADLSVSDGPFTETKEAIGGYFLIKADDEADAIRISQDCPGLKRGTVIELHEIIDHSNG
jgi:hypothetical protein